MPLACVAMVRFLQPSWTDYMTIYIYIYTYLYMYTHVQICQFLSTTNAVIEKTTEWSTFDEGHFMARSHCWNGRTVAWLKGSTSSDRCGTWSHGAVEREKLMNFHLHHVSWISYQSTTFVFTTKNESLQGFHVFEIINFSAQNCLCFHRAKGVVSCFLTGWIQRVALKLTMWSLESYGSDLDGKKMTLTRGIVYGNFS